MTEFNHLKIKKDLAKGHINQRTYLHKVDIKSANFNNTDIYKILLQKFKQYKKKSLRISIFNQARTSPLFKLSDFTFLDKKLIMEVL